MWFTAVGGVGFLGLGVSDAARAYTQGRLAQRIDSASFPDQNRQSGFVVLELSSSAQKVNGFVLAEVMKKDDVYEIVSSEVIPTSSTPKSYALQAHWNADRLETRSCFDVLASVSLFSIAGASQRLNEKMQYLKDMSWPEGLRHQEGETPRFPRTNQRVAFASLGLFSGIAATWQFHKYWNLKQEQS